jgi:ribosomal protein L37E
MIEAFKETGDNVVMVPVMKNLWIFDWKCPKCGLRVYQDKPSTCPTCKVKMYKKMIWQAKKAPNSASYCFDSEPHFQYWNEYKAKQEGDLVESMGLQGSCFMATREKYWELNLCDETLGSWGNQGIELACKAWLSGGRVIVNKRTWYAHLFRTKGVNGFGFPYENKESDVQITKKKVKDLFWDFKYEKQIYPVSWLVERFAPCKGWSDEDLINLKKNNG